MILATHGIVGSSIVQFTGLLDDYSGAAAAYSLRLLSSTYTGDAIRVRRASDNTEQDIGFVSNELDTSTLETFCSGTDGYVKTWYDQSGNGYDASNTTAANQPQIVSSGSVITENGNPSVQFIDTSGSVVTQFLVLSNPYTASTQYIYTFIAYSINANGFFPALFGSDVNKSDRGYTLTHFSGDRTPRIFTVRTGATSIGQSTGALTTNQMYLRSDYADRVDIKTYINTSNVISVSDNNSDFNMPNNTYFGNINNTVVTTNFKISEFIFYPSDQSSNRTGIETNINDFYSIY